MTCALLAGCASLALQKASMCISSAPFAEYQGCMVGTVTPEVQMEAVASAATEFFF
jgi:hypothetical protein